MRVAIADQLKRALGLLQSFVIYRRPGRQKALRRLTRHQPGLVCLPLAVGRIQGQAELALSLRNPAVASLNSGWREHLRTTTAGFQNVCWEDSVTVAVTTLDQAVRCLEELERLGRHELNAIAGEQRRFI